MQNVVNIAIEISQKDITFYLSSLSQIIQVLINKILKVSGPFVETLCVFLYKKYHKCWNVGMKKQL